MTALLYIMQLGGNHMKEAAFSLVIVVLLGLSSCCCGKEVNHADCGDFDSFETGTSRVDIEEMSETITPTQYIETIPYTEFIAEEKKNRGIDSEDMIGDKKEFMGIAVSSPEKTIHELVTKQYPDEILQSIEEGNLTLSELNELYPVESLRIREGLSSVYYRVAYKGDASIAYLEFDSQGNRMDGTMQRKIARPLVTRSRFTQIPEDAGLDEIEQIDPDGEYLFLWESGGAGPRESTHYTTDGYLIYVEYDFDYETGEYPIVRIIEDLI